MKRDGVGFSSGKIRAISAGLNLNNLCGISKVSFSFSGLERIRVGHGPLNYILYGRD